MNTVRNVLKERQDREALQIERDKAILLVNDLGIKPGTTGRNVIVECIAYGGLHKEISVDKKLSNIKNIYSPVGIKMFFNDLTLNGQVIDHKRIYCRMEANIRRTIGRTLDPRITTLTSNQYKNWARLFGDTFMYQPPNTKSFIYTCIASVRAGDYNFGFNDIRTLSESDIIKLREIIREEVINCLKERL